MSNIAEGHERGSTKEYHRFLTMSKASCAEVRWSLYIARDAGYLDDATVSAYLSRTQRGGQLVGA
jgi:four helix bundle protein